MQLFFSKDIDGKKIFLNEDESKHCIKVLRKKSGDLIDVIDGNGNYFIARIENAAFKATEAIIVERRKNWNISPYKISIAVSISKNPERFEWFCEKATEIGIHQIIPIIAERTESKKIKIERINKILISAMKQSGKALLPEIIEPVKFPDFIKSDEKYTDYRKFIAWCETKEERHLKNYYKKGEHALILIGPEVDFTNDEVTAAKQSNFIPVSLGKSRLRLETAGIVACHIVNLLNDE
jgi:16S rRNA (uracil1498-N3)-methyltransferase